MPMVSFPFSTIWLFQLRFLDWRRHFYSSSHILNFESFCGRWSSSVAELHLERIFFVCCYWHLRKHWLFLPNKRTDCLVFFRVEIWWIALSLGCWTEVFAETSLQPGPPLVSVSSQWGHLTLEDLAVVHQPRNGTPGLGLVLGTFQVKRPVHAKLVKVFVTTNLLLWWPVPEKIYISNSTVM